MLSIHLSSNHYEYIFSLCYMSFCAGHFSACTPSLYSSSIIQRRPLLDVLWTGDILLAGPVSCQSKRHQGSQVTQWTSVCRIDCSLSSRNILGTKLIFWKAEITVMKEPILPIWIHLKAKNPWKSVCSSSLYEKWLCDESIPEMKKSMMWG